MKLSIEFAVDENSKYRYKRARFENHKSALFSEFYSRILNVRIEMKGNYRFTIYEHALKHQ